MLELKTYTTMLVIFIPSNDLCLHRKVEENVNGRAICMNVVVER